MENKENMNEKLFKLQQEIGKVSKQSENPFFRSKYMDINSLLEAVYPLLKEHRLLLLQPINEGDVITQIIDLDTDDFVESRIKLPESIDPQKIGSAITYYRRYALKSLLGIQEEDDDGNKSSKKAIAWLTKEQFEKALNSDVKGISATLQSYSTSTHSMSKPFKDGLEQKLNELI